jgi:hypothetical protein
VSFAPDGVGWFAAESSVGRWTCDLADSSGQTAEILDLRQKMPGFDNKLKTVLYGQHARIYVFDHGFTAILNGPADNPQHPLYQALVKYTQEGWDIDEGSSLSLYDHRYYLLKFRKTGSPELPCAWNVPDHMDSVIADVALRDSTPEDQEGGCPQVLIRITFC